MMEAIKGDLLTPERRAKMDVEIVDGKRGGLEYLAAQVPIDYYFKQRRINVRERNAANKLFRDFTISGQTPGMTIDLNPVRSGHGGFTEAQLEARERWRQAILAVQGQIAKLIIIDVCCYGKWLKDTHYRHYNNAEKAMSRFHEALEDLIEHYDLTKQGH